jgi:hypothetical protein
VPIFQSRINAEKLEDYKWSLRTSWAELERRAQLSSGWIGGLVRNKHQRTSVNLRTLDAIANAIASILVEQGKPVPDDLWFQLVEIEIREDNIEGEGVSNQS